MLLYLPSLKCEAVAGDLLTSGSAAGQMLRWAAIPLPTQATAQSTSGCWKPAALTAWSCLYRSSRRCRGTPGAGHDASLPTGKWPKRPLTQLPAELSLLRAPTTPRRSPYLPPHQTTTSNTR